MVYKKYIKRNGKKFGPYYYENYREDGKVKTRFISGPSMLDKYKNLIWIIFLLVIVLGILYLIIF